MNKNEFLSLLRDGLSGLPKDDADERVDFYSEMIDDRMEEGLTEEEAVKEIGDVDSVISQIAAETPLVKLVKEKIKPNRRFKAWEILLLALGAPVWAPIIISLLAAVFSVYVSLWSVVISLWAVFVSLAASAVGVTIGGIVMICTGNAFTGIIGIGGGFVCAGLAILFFFLCKAVTVGFIRLTKLTLIKIKTCFVKKEAI